MKGVAEENASDLRVFVDPDIADLVEPFLLGRRTDLGRLREAITKADLAIVRRIGHTIRGSAGMFGFHRMAEVGASLESSASLPAAAAFTDALEAHLDRVQWTVAGAGP